MLGTIPLAVIARQTRSAMLEVLGEDYVRTARAKGLAPRRVVGAPRLPQRADPGRHHHRPAGRAADGRRHPHRNDLFLAGHRQVDDRLDLASATTSSVQSGLLLIALIVMAVNLIVDILYAVINPRIRVQ